MGIKPELAFDVCWEVYCGAREILEVKRGSVTAIDWQQDAKYLWRPDLHPKLKDWVADFALAGQAALSEPERASRMVMFRLYYLGLAEYNRARHFLGLSEQGSIKITLIPNEVRDPSSIFRVLSLNQTTATRASDGPVSPYSCSSISNHSIPNAQYLPSLATSHPRIRR